MFGQSVFNFLDSIGCCKRCILIYLGERSNSLYVNLSSIDEVLAKAVSALDQELGDQEVHEENGSQHKPEDVEVSSEREKLENLIDDGADLNTSNNNVCELSSEKVKLETSTAGGTPEHVSKKQKCTVCVTCIGLFQHGCSPSVIKQISDALISGDPDADAFTLALALPICLSLRVHRVWILLMQAYPNMPDLGRIDHIGMVKDVWKNLVGPQLGKIVNKTFVHGQYAEFLMNVSASYVDDIADCKILDLLCEKMFSIRRKQHKKYSTGVYSKQSVDCAIKKLKDEEFLKACPDPPLAPVQPVSFADLKWQRESLYMAGRYNKYSRDLPQTPWFVEGERKMGSSVQELLCASLDKSVNSDEYRFSSSGREDVDVRCLGNGRPFVVEFVNPCRTIFSQVELTEFQKEVNLSSSLIRLRDLQIVDKKEVKSLKEGEEEKTKAYCALCIAREGYEPALLDRLSGMTELTVQQKTPVRVLHRRTLKTRPRIIHEMKASSIDKFFFKLHLTTQAGTYIKEFVHGDLGRTTPNLKSILGVEVDIIALDVERVALDWPPECDG